LRIVLDLEDISRIKKIVALVSKVNGMAVTLALKILASNTSLCNGCNDFFYP